MSDKKRKQATRKQSTKPPPSKPEKAVKPKEARTLISWKIPDSLLEKVKNLAYWKRDTSSNIFLTATQNYIDEHEREHGKIKPRPAE